MFLISGLSRNNQRLKHILGKLSHIQITPLDLFIVRVAQNCQSVVGVAGSNGAT